MAIFSGPGPLVNKVGPLFGSVLLDWWKEARARQGNGHFMSFPLIKITKTLIDFCCVCFGNDGGGGGGTFNIIDPRQSVHWLEWWWCSLLGVK